MPRHLVVALLFVVALVTASLLPAISTAFSASPTPAISSSTPQSAPITTVEIPASPIPAESPPPTTAAPVSPARISPAPVNSAPPSQVDRQTIIKQNVCWLPGTDYITYVKPSDHSYFWFFVRNISPATQIQTPAWPHWTQNQGGEFRVEGQYKDANGQDMWAEYDFFTAPFWSDQPTSKQQAQVKAYNQIKKRWPNVVETINTTSRC